MHASVLKAGDVILSINQKAGSSPEDLTQELARRDLGTKVDLKIVRGKQEMAVTVEFPKLATVGRGIVL